MKSRCYNPRFPKFKDYGERGIKVCERWRTDFAAFLADVGMPPSKRHTLERKDNAGDYAPENVVWATRQEQQRNKRTNVLLTWNGSTKCLSEWSELLGIKMSTLSARVRAGWSADDALTSKFGNHPHH